MGKYFIFGFDEKLSKEENDRIQKERAEQYLGVFENRIERSKVKELDKFPPINAPENRIIIAVDMNKKSTYRMDDGSLLSIERNFDNFDRKYVAPVNAIVISGSGMPSGSEIIIHHNCTHETNRIFNIGDKYEGESELRYFSILEGQAYLYRIEGTEEWLPCKNFATALRVFKPYNGDLKGIEPTKIIDKLYITSGELKGKVVLTLKSCDYEMVFQGLNGREQRVIRLRHFGFEEGTSVDFKNVKVLSNSHEREEIIAIDWESTDLVLKGELYLGLNSTDCKPINQLQDAQ